MNHIMFLLWHEYELLGQEEIKLLGIFSTPALANAALERMRQQPGFKDHIGGLSVAEVFTDRDLWPEGFVVEWSPSDEGLTEK